MILVTGASGNVGKEVLQQLASTGAGIRAAYQSAEKASAAPAGVETVIMDFNQPATVAAACAGIERMFLVGPPTADMPAMEAKAVAQAKQSGVRHLVKLSAMGGRGSTFPAQHADSEDNIKASGVAYTFLRPNGFMQNMVNFNAGLIQSQGAFYGCQGDGRVSHIDVRDIGAVAVQVLTGSGHEGQAYTLTGPEALTNAELAAILSEVLGRTIRYVDLPPEMLKQGAMSAGIPPWSAEALTDLQVFYSRGGASEVTPVVAQLLGRPARNFRQFVTDYAAAFRA